ncbi:O-antigen ligase family protein [Fructobacillus parabroussonetiae]|uniref:O-antigen ligase family protein n=1 Tax=Fructobacillus parabroussonetiae TaxID=2713174 RepID=A0ABS5QY74_9LACO|nr:O-antigen ligase family protein [Fructobacillus parabroussonetiae]MBS9337742.1 O-antigen ligase family protein [Fructobacillus parabroussonetiae]
MVNFLLPITFFSKMYTYSLAEPLTMVAFPFFVCTIFYQLFCHPDRIKRIIPSKKAILISAFVWIEQLVVMLYSYSQVGENKVTWGLLHSPLNLAGWTIAIYIAWAVIRVCVMTEEDEKKLIKSALIGLTIYLLLVIFPQVLVTFHVQTLKSYVNGIASLFESHWQAHSGYNFYSHGSYVTTLNRVNGFEPEASYLANQLSVVYLPILIALAVSDYSLWEWAKQRNWLINLIFAFLVMSVLVLARTSTGIFAVVVAFALWLLWSKGKIRATVLSIAFVSFVGLILAYETIPAIHSTLNQFLFAKQGTDNRTGGTIALALTFLAHPLFGVGTGFTSYYIIQNMPEAFTHNFEYEHVYSQYGFPILSESLGWFASFGLVVMIPALFLLFKLVARSYLKTYRLNQQKVLMVDQKWDRTMHIAFITMIIMIAFSSIFIIRIYLWPYLLMFFFYREHLLRVEQELK